MKKIIFISLVLGVFMNLNASFFDEQKRFERVRVSIKEKDDLVLKSLKENSININSLNILMIAYKDEGILQIWGKNSDKQKYKLIKQYDICAKSGELGPKYKQGDGQVPEGFYHIDRFNPASSYYLSLGINYPNSTDKIRSNAKNFGGDIFIHGKCVTIGCLPMSDDGIKEIYLYALYAKNASQSKIPVYIYPFKMSEKNFFKYEQIYKNSDKLIKFWRNLKQGYDKFEADNNELLFSSDNNGGYEFN